MDSGRYPTQLEICRRKMEEKGVHADLAEHGLGPGKMFARADQAWAVLQQLVEQGKVMKSSDVVLDLSLIHI